MTHHHVIDSTVNKTMTSVTAISNNTVLTAYSTHSE